MNEENLYRTNIFQVKEVLDFSWNLGSQHRPSYLNILFHPAFQIGQYLISSIEIYHKAIPACHFLVKFYTVYSHCVGIEISYIAIPVLHAGQTTYFW